MKKHLFFLFLLAFAVNSLLAQPVKDYLYKLDNGITVRTEHCWSQVWVQQSYTALSAKDKSPLSVNIRTLGDLISGSTYKLLNAGKEIKMQSAMPGTYDLKLTFKLSGKPGTLSFDVSNILIKSKTKTDVSITLYDYQIMIGETPEPAAGLTSYVTQVNRCKASPIQDLYFGIPTFYQKGNHDVAVSPDQVTDKTSGKIKPGTYDLLISIVISGQTQNIWLDNFTMKPDIKYKIATNLNAGGITYAGLNKDVTRMELYPAGTADRQTGNPAPNKSTEIISYDNVKLANCCSPGAYDVLLNIKNGSKYEWRKNVIIQTGSKTEVK